jgi:hypothetical protein
MLQGWLAMLSCSLAVWLGMLVKLAAWLAILAMLVICLCWLAAYDRWLAEHHRWICWLNGSRGWLFRVKFLAS